MTALANVAEGLISVKQMAKPAAHVQAMSLLQRMSLVDKANAFPATLSGGQKQRLSLALAMIGRPELIFLDEPTAALDARAEFEVFQRFKELSEAKTAVLISHRFSTVRRAERIVALAP